MSENIEIFLGAGKSFLLETAGKICDKNIVVRSEAAHDTFWDVYQNNGDRVNYSYAFAGLGWNNDTFTPKYPIRVVGDASYMFSYCSLTEYDFVEKGIDLDFSGATKLTYLFRDCKGIVRVGAIDVTGCKDVNRPFFGSGIKTIDSFIVSEATIYDNTFASATELENITVNGTIGKSISFKDSKALSNASIQSIIDHLKDLTGATAQTLTFHATVGANLTQAQKDAITAKNWQLVY